MQTLADAFGNSCISYLFYCFHALRRGLAGQRVTRLFLCWHVRRHLLECDDYYPPVDLVCMSDTLHSLQHLLEKTQAHGLSTNYKFEVPDFKVRSMSRMPPRHTTPLHTLVTRAEMTG